MEDTQSVWIVDGDEETCLRIGGMLTDFGYEPRYRVSAEEALSEVASMNADLPHAIIIGNARDGFKADLFAHIFRTLGKPWVNKVMVVGLVDSNDFGMKESLQNEGVTCIDREHLTDVDVVAHVMRALVDRENTGSWKLKEKNGQ